MARVFISYRRKDSATLATLLAKELERQRMRVFVDTRSIDGGGPFPDRLRRAIAECEVFVCLLGATTLESRWVREEIAYAHQLNKVMLPVFQEKYVPPDPIPDEHVYALLQSDGVKILDVQNVYVDQAIADLRKMIRGSVRRRLPRVAYIAAALLVIMAGVISLALAASQPPVSTNTPSASVTTAGPAAADNPTATTAPPLTPTERPTLTHTPTTPPTLSPEQLALTPVARNADWTPYERDFSGVTMMLVPAGCFMMGSEDGDSNEQPIHEQCFEQPFWIDKFEVTNAQFALFNGIAAHNGNLTGDGLPREMVNWFETQSFCEQRGGRLPTEREWEYAARGPDNLAYPWGEVFAAENTVYADNSNRHTFIVGSRSSGASWVGTQDLSGNVWEWTNSLYKNYPYIATDGREQNTESVIDIQRVLRGGSFDNTPLFLRTMSRFRRDPYFVAESIGFRCARDF